MMAEKLEKSDISQKIYYEMMRGMLRIRRVEEKIIELYKAGHIVAPVHLSIGQEASAVGVMSALRPSDKVVSTHRCHGHYLAKGGNLEKMLAELCGRSGGCAGGYGGTMHLTDDESGFVVAAPIVGASIAFAVGIAFAAKLKCEDKIAVAFFGDGAVEEGIFWESVNFASVHRLPVLFVCENNLYATHSPILKRQPSVSIVERVSPHGIECAMIENGNDVLAVYEAAKKAVSSARNNRPFFIETRTYRYKEHWGAGEDWHLGYRSREEGERWLLRDPLSFREKFAAEEIAGMEAEIKKEIDEAERFAFSSRAPDSEEMIKGKII
ncbi:MAG: thiamine pyrophosphate-dependent dehydrogenase E1 component subunit alpha [Patescibacteria group bacterium]